MTRDGVIQLILARLRRVGDTALAGLIVPELNLFQQTEAEGSAMGQMWFLLRYAELELSVDRRQATLPDDFLSFPQEFDCIFLPAGNAADPTAMVVSTRFLAGQTFTGQYDASSGAGWSLQGSTINFATQLAASDTPVAIYYGREPLNELAYGAGSQPSPNAWMVNAPDWFIAEMCWLMGTNYLSYDDAEARFGAQRARAQNRLHTMNVMQEEGARIRILNEYYSRSREARGGFTLEA